MVVFRFTIEFKAGDDVAFHFDVSYNFCGDRNLIVRNSFLNHHWGKEERYLPHSFPFPQDFYFEMLVLVAEKSYKVKSVNV